MYGKGNLSPKTSNGLYDNIIVCAIPSLRPNGSFI